MLEIIGEQLGGIVWYEEQTWEITKMDLWHFRKKQMKLKCKEQYNHS